MNVIYKICISAAVLVVIFLICLSRRNKKISRSTILLMSAILIPYVVLIIMFFEYEATRGIAALDRRGRYNAQNSKKIEFNNIIVPIFEKTNPKRKFNISFQALDVFVPSEKPEDSLSLLDGFRRISINFHIAPVEAYGGTNLYDSLIEEGFVGSKKFKKYINAPPRPRGRSRPEPTYKFEMTMPLESTPSLIANCRGSAMKETDFAELRDICLSLSVQPAQADLGAPTPNRTVAK